MGEVNVSGPLFNGSAPSVFARIRDEAQEQVAAQASAQVHLHMNHFFRHPTPYYETQITTQRRGASLVVHDRGIVYGPWLAGVGSRNKTSRFKGYAHWRLAVQEANQAAPTLVAAVVAKHLRELQ